MNRRRFSSDGFNTSMSMRSIVKGSCWKKGIISKPDFIDYSQDMVDFSIEKVKYISRLAESMYMASVRMDFELTFIQLASITSIIYRRSGRVSIGRIVRHFDENGKQMFPYNLEKTRVFGTPATDIGSPVFLDIPTGTGKTITSLLGSIVFSIERKDDIKKEFSSERHCSSNQGIVEITDVPPVGKDQGSQKCIFFIPKHLMQHWNKHAEIAKKIVEDMVFQGVQWKVRIVENELASNVTCEKNEIVVILCDLVRCGTSKYLEPTVRYASVCFEEAGELGSKNNALHQKLRPGVKFGRLLAVSADFSKWARNTSREDTVMQSIMPTHTFHQKEDRLAIAVLGSTFPESQRRWVLHRSTEHLKDSTLDIATVKYTPSLIERVIGGFSSDLGNDKGCDIFKSKYGVDVSKCETIADIIEAIKKEVNVLKVRHEEYLLAYRVEVDEVQLFGTPSEQQNERYRLEQSFSQRRQDDYFSKRRCDNLEKLIVKIGEVKSDDCPICLEKISDLSLIQPCLHFTCKTCMHKVILKKKCPICRGSLCGTVGISTSDTLGKRKKSSETIEEPKPVIVPGSGWSSKVGDLFFDEMASVCGEGNPVGITNLKSIQMSRTKSLRYEKTFRTMLICPDVDIKDKLFEGMGFEVFHYRTHGTYQNKVTRKRMDSLIKRFEDSDGKSKLFCVRDSDFSKKGDNMTGLDIHLDCVISIGNQNYAQRVGRICRMSRAFLPKVERDALYVQIVKE